MLGFALTLGHLTFGRWTFGPLALVQSEKRQTPLVSPSHRSPPLMLTPLALCLLTFGPPRPTPLWDKARCPSRKGIVIIRTWSQRTC